MVNKKIDVLSLEQELRALDTRIIKGEAGDKNLISPGQAAADYARMMMDAEGTCPNLKRYQFR